MSISGYGNWKLFLSHSNYDRVCADAIARVWRGRWLRHVLPWFDQQTNVAMVDFVDENGETRRLQASRQQVGVMAAQFTQLSAMMAVNDGEPAGTEHLLYVDADLIEVTLAAGPGSGLLHFLTGFADGLPLGSIMTVDDWQKINNKVKALLEDRLN